MQVCRLACGRKLLFQRAHYADQVTHEVAYFVQASFCLQIDIVNFRLRQQVGINVL